VSSVDGDEILKRIEEYGRVCYKSENRITEDSAKRFVENLIKRGHESVLEHISVTVKFVCDRGVSHEIVRHRLASYSQESTRYCNYSKDDFGSEITVIEPCFLVPGTAGYDMWYRACLVAEQMYFKMLDWGCTPEEARAVLPNSLKTELVMTANLREWRHFFKLRTSKAAHPQMRELTVPLLGEEFKEKIPVVFDDIKVEE
jgi:thymidylate synthase (FAD)